MVGIKIAGQLANLRFEQVPFVTIMILGLPFHSFSY